MTKTYFPDPEVRQRLYEGPLAIHVDAFAELLAHQGIAARQRGTSSDSSPI